METLPVTFALVGPSEPGNAGAAARSLTAFGFDDLCLVARAPATLAQRREILARAEALLAALDYPSRALSRHPPEAYLSPVRSGPLSRKQAQWLLGLLTRLERRLARD